MKRGLGVGAAAATLGGAAYLYNRHKKTASGEYSVAPGYMDAQQGMYRAMRSGNAGADQFLSDSALIGGRLKGMAVGGGGGALAGAGIAALLKAKGISPGAGAWAGGILGGAAGAARAEDSFLKKKGIDRRFMGLGGANFTPEAAERYGVKSASLRKTASIAEYSVLFDKVASGDLGEHTRQALLGICDTIPEPSTLSEKSASVYDATDLSEDAARKARLDQLLRR